ncbi:MAG TPA: hemerythrin domain-containing protein, partial [Vicinamibacteria bacterium]|nr:hemerythrin domain-containing protein [Vicinamibacteria bacterium]
CEQVMAEFDALAPGETLVVLSGHLPQRLLGKLQAERKGLFEWSPLEGGPERYRTELTRRAAEPGARRGVNEALAWDHDRLEAIEARAFERHAAGDTEGACAAWAEFSYGLRRHIRFEEDLLFPAFEAATGMAPDAGPTAVMRSEHRWIEELIEAVAEALAGGGAVLPIRVELQRVLGGHNMKEEQVLYPLTDGRLGPEEADALVARIQAS